MKQGSGPGSIDEYILACPPSVQKRLKTIRRLVRRLAPDATEKISYQMPTFYLNGNLVYFAAHSKHIGFYPGTSAMAHFKLELAPYQKGKGTLQFPMDEPLPVRLIEDIVKIRVQGEPRQAPSLVRCGHPDLSLRFAPSQRSFKAVQLYPEQEVSDHWACSASRKVDQSRSWRAEASRSISYRRKRLA